MSLLLALQGATDTTPPVVTIISGPTRSKMSRQVGADASDFVWSSDEDFASYQIRLVPSSTDSVTAGSQIEQNQTPPSGGTAGTQYTATITDDELVAAGALDGNLIVKVFVQDAAGNWSL